ncbi:hypothetical protein [Streptomyces sp. NPDC089795]|uniref:hypothetical protein n=1 Tax=Streptomyces sp. NPDC089795 TaxID=3155297 RepID=UPI00343C4846
MDLDSDAVPTGPSGPGTGVAAQALLIAGPELHRHRDRKAADASGDVETRVRVRIRGRAATALGNEGAALRGDRVSVPAPRVPGVITFTVEETGDRIESWLERHAPVTHGLLRPPALLADIAAAEFRLG